MKRDAVLAGEPLEGPGLAGAVDDLADQPPGQPPVGDLQRVGRSEVEPEELRQRIGDLAEPAAHDAAAEAEALEGADRRTRPRGELEFGRDVVEHVLGHVIAQPIDQVAGGRGRRG